MRLRTPSDSRTYSLPMTWLRSVIIALVAVLTLVLPPLAANAGIGPEDRTAVLVMGPTADRLDGVRAALAAAGRPLTVRFDGRLVLVAFDRPIDQGTLRRAGVLLVLDAALLKGCGVL